MSAAVIDPPTCRCWRCWTQDNFTVIVLFVLVIVSLSLTILIMHEKSLPDEYAKWAQGWTGGLLTGLTLAMNNSASANRPHIPNAPAPEGQKDKP